VQYLIDECDIEDCLPDLRYLLMCGLGPMLMSNAGFVKEFD
jgi:hypothetical protein